MTRDELKIRTQQAIDYIPTLMERDDGWSEIESILYEILTELDDKDGNWHTGIPTEEGWYLCSTKASDFSVHHYNGNEWDFCPLDFVVAWMKIEPYKEKEDAENSFCS